MQIEQRRQVALARDAAASEAAAGVQFDAGAAAPMQHAQDLETFFQGFAANLLGDAPAPAHVPDHAPAIEAQAPMAPAANPLGDQGQVLQADGPMQLNMQLIPNPPLALDPLAGFDLDTMPPFSPSP